MELRTSALTHMSDPYGIAQETTDNAEARFELGWGEVRRGLAWIMRGWILMILSVAIVVAAIVFLFSKGDTGRMRFTSKTRDLGLFLILGGFAITWLYSYACLIAGHWRCLMYAPERKGTKWMMFLCILCVAAGPVMNFGIGFFGGVQQSRQYKRGIKNLEELQDIEVPPAVMATQVAGAVLNVLSLVLFIRFLRSVASCFEQWGRILLADLYLVFYLGTVALTLLLTFGKPPDEMFLPLALSAAGCWVACFSGYLIMIGVARGSITKGLREVRSPFVA